MYAIPISVHILWINLLLKSLILKLLKSTRMEYLPRLFMSQILCCYKAWNTFWMIRKWRISKLKGMDWREPCLDRRDLHIMPSWWRQKELQSLLVLPHTVIFVLATVYSLKWGRRLIGRSMVYILAKYPYLFPPPTFSWRANLSWK